MMQVASMIVFHHVYDSFSSLFRASTMMQVASMIVFHHV